MSEESSQIEITLFRMINGEMVMCERPEKVECPYTGREAFLLKKAILVQNVAVQRAPGQVDMQTRLQSWMAGDDTGIYVSFDAIMGIMDAPETLSRAYVQATTGIAMPQQAKIEVPTGSMRPGAGNGPAR